MKIEKITKHNTNPFYDPDRAWDGGGYYQPDVTVFLSNGGRIVIHDTSCGVFGRRYDAEYISKKGNILAESHFNGMDGQPPIGQEVIWGTFDRFPALAEMIRKWTGYQLLEE